MQKKNTPIVFKAKDGQKYTEITVPTFFLKNWKWLLASLLFAITLSVTLVVKNMQAKTVNHYTHQIDELKKAKFKLTVEGLHKESDFDEVRKTYDAIDSTLNEINSKLKKRGLKSINLDIQHKDSKNPMGGPVEKNTTLADLTAYYEETVKKIDKKLTYTPIGVPHYGKITSRFGYRRNPFTKRGRELHSGVDFKGRTGEPIRSTASGTVTFSGYKGGYGYVVMVRHADGFETRYAHLSKTRVRKGQRVEVGHTVGLLGSTGRSTGPHLHYEILHNGRKINPQKFFQF